MTEMMAEELDQTTTTTAAAKCCTESTDSPTPSVDDECLAELGFMFESNSPTKEEQFLWKDAKGKNILVVLHAVDDIPGAVQSGHYLWPAAKRLADHLVEHEVNDASSCTGTVESVLELGCGCALASLTALQVWQPDIQCIMVTDHDPTVLERARDNLESTLDAILNATQTEEDLNKAINDVGSIPVLYECLEWGKADDLQLIREQLQEHTTSKSNTVDVILGSDLIYCADVVQPLFETVSQLLKPMVGRFLLSQSFAYDDSTEKEIDKACDEKMLVRKILNESDDGTERIQEFRWVVPETGETGEN